MGLEATRDQLKAAHRRVEQYQAALRLASAEIHQRSQGIVSLTQFAHRAGRITTYPALLKLALSQALALLNSPVGAIVLIEAETKNLSLSVHQGLTPGLMDILTGQELGGGAMALMPHLVTGTGALLEYRSTDDAQERLLLETGHLTSLVSLPLQAGPQFLGALLVGLQNERNFSPAELGFLMVMAQQLAIFWENLRLREKLWGTAETLLGDQKTGEMFSPGVTVEAIEVGLLEPMAVDLPTTSAQAAGHDVEQLLLATVEANEAVQQQNADLQTLNTIAEIFNRTLDLSEILQNTVEQTRQALQTEAAWLYLRRADELLEMRAHAGLSPAFLRGMQLLKPGEGLEGRVVADNLPHLVASVAEDSQKHKIWIDKEGLQALAAVPITRPEVTSQSGQTQSNVIGVLIVGKRSEGSYIWSEREVRLLTAIANQVAPAIENAHLYAQVQEDGAGLRVGNEILRSLNDMLLEKNALLEHFVQHDLTPALGLAQRVLQRLATATPATFSQEQRQELAILQKIVTQLTALAHGTAASATELTSEIDPANQRSG
jgi:GAF domain-containing protein